jgi:hypothetical protein
MKNSNDASWNRIRDIKARSTVSQPTAPPRSLVSYMLGCFFVNETVLSRLRKA